MNKIYLDKIKMFEYQLHNKSNYMRCSETNKGIKSLDAPKNM